MGCIYTPARMYSGSMLMEVSSTSSYSSPRGPAAAQRRRSFRRQILESSSQRTRTTYYSSGCVVSLWIEHDPRSSRHPPSTSVARMHSIYIYIYIYIMHTSERISHLFVPSRLSSGALSIPGPFHPHQQQPAHPLAAPFPLAHMVDRGNRPRSRRSRRAACCWWRRPPCCWSASPADPSRRRRLLPALLPAAAVPAAVPPPQIGNTGCGTWCTRRQTQMRMPSSTPTPMPRPNRTGCP